MCEGKRVNTGVVLGVCIICLSKGTPPLPYIHSGQESPGNGREQVLGEE